MCVVSGKYIVGHSLEARVKRMVQRWALGEGYYCKAAVEARAKACRVRLAAAVKKANAGKKAKAEKKEKVVVIKVEKQ